MMEPGPEGARVFEDHLEYRFGHQSRVALWVGVCLVCAHAVLGLTLSFAVAGKGAGEWAWMIGAVVLAIGCLHFALLVNRLRGDALEVFFFKRLSERAPAKYEIRYGRKLIASGELTAEQICICSEDRARKGLTLSVIYHVLFRPHHHGAREQPWPNDLILCSGDAPEACIEQRSRLLSVLGMPRDDPRRLMVGGLWPTIGDAELQNASVFEDRVEYDIPFMGRGTLVALASAGVAWLSLGVVGLAALAQMLLRTSADSIALMSTVIGLFVLAGTMLPLGRFAFSTIRRRGGVNRVIFHRTGDDETGLTYEVHAGRELVSRGHFRISQLRISGPEVDAHAMENCRLQFCPDDPAVKAHPRFRGVVLLYWDRTREPVLGQLRLLASTLGFEPTPSRWQ